MVGQHNWHLVGTSAAEGYERFMVPAIFAAWAPTLVESAAIRPGESVLDVACGTGVVTRLAATQVGDAGRVVGLDFNAGMLEVARSLPLTPGAQIEWCEASAFAMPLPTSAFDVVLCQQGLQQFSDRPSALSEMHRVLRDAGRLAVSVWTRIEQSPGFAALVDALERHVSTAAANNRRAPFALSNAGEIERLVNDAGFRDATLRTMVGTARFPSPEQFVEYQLASGPMAAFGAITEHGRADVIRDVRGALDAYTNDDGLAFPMEAYVVLARK